MDDNSLISATSSLAVREYGDILSTYCSASIHVAGCTLCVSVQVGRQEEEETLDYSSWLPPDGWLEGVSYLDMAMITPIFSLQIKVVTGGLPSMTNMDIEQH